MPTTQAVDLIESAHFKWVDQVYQGSIPFEESNDTSQTVLLATEYLSEPTKFGNSKFKGWLIGVEIQIFYKASVDINLLDAEIALAKLFEQNNWFIEQSKNHSKDPDTNQVSKVFFFTKKIILKETN